MLYKTRALVLHTIKYGESGILLHSYTELFGKQVFLVRGARRPKSKMTMSLFQPLSLLFLEIYNKEGRNIQHIKEVKPIQVMHSLYTDIRKSTVALFLSEVLFRVLKEEEANKKLFEYLYHSVQLLDVAQKGVENFHIIFLLQLLRFLGIYPSQITDIIGRNKLNFTVDLKQIAEYSLLEIGSFKFSKDERNIFLEELLQYYLIHLEGMGQIRSMKILTEVFQ